MGNRAEMTDARLATPDRAVFEHVNRGRLRVWEWGDPADPVVFLLHGAHDHGRMWDALAPQFAALGFHVRAVDGRGHGESTGLGSGHAWNLSTLDIGALLAACTGPAGLIGHSMGASLATGAAATWPERVAWLVNIDGLGPPPFEPSEMSLIEVCTRSLEIIDRQQAGARAFPDLQAMIERRAAVNVRLPRAWIEHLVAHGHVETSGGVAFATDPLFNVGIPDTFDAEVAIAPFRRVVAPTLIITGAEPDTWSDLAPDDVARRVGEFPDAEHLVVDGAGHYAHVERPDVVLPAICDFIAAQPPVAGRCPAPTAPPAVPAPDAPGDGVPVDAIAAETDFDEPGRLVVLHELGDPLAGRVWRDAAGRWPGRIDAPDLPGHRGIAPPPSGHYEHGDVPFYAAPLLPPLVPDAAEQGPIVLGIGQSGWSALVAGLGGRASAVVLVDGLGTPWVTSDDSFDEQADRSRGLLDDPAAVAPPSGAVDPRIAHTEPWPLSRDLVERALRELPVPLVVIETHRSRTPPHAAEELVGTGVVRLPDRDPTIILDAVRDQLTGALVSTG